MASIIDWWEPQNRSFRALTVIRLVYITSSKQSEMWKSSFFVVRREIIVLEIYHSSPRLISKLTVTFVISHQLPSTALHSSLASELA
jgi:hypothetical protein